MTKTCLSPMLHSLSLSSAKGRQSEDTLISRLLVSAAALSLRKRNMKGRRRRRDRASCFLSASRGNTVSEVVWERQSQQLGAQRDTEGLLGRMQAKGIVGNYTGLERASNAFIQRDIFIKKRDCQTGTKRERERNLNWPFFPSSPGLDFTETFFLFLCVAFASWHVCEQLSVLIERDNIKGKHWRFRLSEVQLLKFSGPRYDYIFLFRCKRDVDMLVEYTGVFLDISLSIRKQKHFVLWYITGDSRPSLKSELESCRNTREVVDGSLRCVITRELSSTIRLLDFCETCQVSIMRET